MNRRSILSAATATVAMCSALVVSGGGITSASTLGQLDPTFDNDGEVIVSIPNEDWILNDMVIQSDGRIVVGGMSIDASNIRGVFVGRFNADGSEDQTWGVNGVITPTPVVNQESGVGSMALQPDGKVIVAGAIFDNSVTPSVSTIMVGRLDTTGQPDSSFDQDGFLTTAHRDESIVGRVVLQPDGKIVIVGRSDDQSNGNTTASYLTIARYTTTGALDTTFNANGATPGVFDYGSSAVTNYALAVAVQPDGKIVVGGSFESGVIITRLLTDGTPDPTFGTSGVFTTQFLNRDSHVSDLIVQADGKIVVVGHYVDSNGDSRPAITRLTPNGSFDPGFGNAGVIFPTIPSVRGYPYRVKMLRDGRIVVTGSLVYNMAKTDFVMWVFNADGSPDTSVYPTGSITLTKGGIIQGGDYRMFAMEIQSDDKIVVSGVLETTENQPAIARFNSLIPASTPTTQAPPVTTVAPAALTGAPTPLTYRAANKQVTLRWRAVEGAASYVVTTTRGSQRCDTTATSCVIPRLRNGKAYTYLVYSVNTNGVRSETGTRISARPGFVVKRTSMKAKRTLKLSSIVSTKSKGTKAWRVTSGGCRIQGDRLVAPTKRGTCRLRLATTKRGSYPAMSTTIKLTITR